jgi:hypothetical protein
VRVRLTRLAAPALFALGASLLLAWDGMLTVSFTDYEREAEPSFAALRLGHVGDFLAHLPAYGGSLILRAPFALLPNLWHGGSLSLYRSVAVPCLLAAVVLGLLLWARLSLEGRGTRAGWLALALCVANPITLRALEIGHPEDLLGACLCVGAVIAALDSRSSLAGVLLGLAVANKPWAVLAALPVLLAAPGGRVKAAAIAAGVAAVIVAPMVLAGSQGVGTARYVATNSGPGFTPWEAWWFLGSHGQIVRGVYGIMPGYRTPPGWLGSIGHLLVVLSALPLSALWWLRRRADRARLLAGRAEAVLSHRGDALLLLALVMQARCLLDPWNLDYYALPLLLALTTWEGLARRRMPLAALAVTLAGWTSFDVLRHGISPDAQALFFLLWNIPLFALLAWRLYAPASFARRWQPLARGLQARLPTVARALQARGAEAAPAA